MTMYFPYFKILPVLVDYHYLFQFFVYLHVLLYCNIKLFFGKKCTETFCFDEAYMNKKKIVDKVPLTLLGH